KSHFPEEASDWRSGRQPSVCSGLLGRASGARTVLRFDFRFEKRFAFCFEFRANPKSRRFDGSFGRFRGNLGSLRRHRRNRQTAPTGVPSDAVGGLGRRLSAKDCHSLRSEGREERLKGANERSPDVRSVRELPFGTRSGFCGGNGF
ncbi:unnamed protein product, partial [Oppiella nova]